MSDSSWVKTPAQTQRICRWAESVEREELEFMQRASPVASLYSERRSPVTVGEARAANNLANLEQPRSRPISAISVRSRRTSPEVLVPSTAYGGGRRFFREESPGQNPRERSRSASVKSRKSMSRSASPRSTELTDRDIMPCLREAHRQRQAEKSRRKAADEMRCVSPPPTSSLDPAAFTMSPILKKQVGRTPPHVSSHSHFRVGKFLIYKGVGKMSCFGNEMYVCFRRGHASLRQRSTSQSPPRNLTDRYSGQHLQLAPASPTSFRLSLSAAEFRGVRESRETAHRERVLGSAAAVARQVRVKFHDAVLQEMSADSLEPVVHERPTPASTITAMPERKSPDSPAASSFLRITPREREERTTPPLSPEPIQFHRAGRLKIGDSRWVAPPAQNLRESLSTKSLRESVTLTTELPRQSIANPDSPSMLTRALKATSRTGSSAGGSSPGHAPQTPLVEGGPIRISPNLSDVMSPQQMRTFVAWDSANSNVHTEAAEQVVHERGRVVANNSPKIRMDLESMVAERLVFRPPSLMPDPLRRSLEGKDCSHGITDLTPVIDIASANNSPTSLARKRFPMSRSLIRGAPTDIHDKRVASVLKGVMLGTLRSTFDAWAIHTVSKEQARGDRRLAGVKWIGMWLNKLIRKARKRALQTFYLQVHAEVRDLTKRIPLPVYRALINDHFFFSSTHVQLKRCFAAWTQFRHYNSFVPRQCLAMLTTANSQLLKLVFHAWRVQKQSRSEQVALPEKAFRLLQGYSLRICLQLWRRQVHITNRSDKYFSRWDRFVAGNSFNTWRQNTMYLSRVRRQLLAVQKVCDAVRLRGAFPVWSRVAAAAGYQARVAEKEELLEKLAAIEEHFTKCRIEHQ